MKKLVLFFVSIMSIHSFADEGMWTLNNFPRETVKKKYQFDATPDWVQHVQLSSARLAGGCSGSFVSNQGLILTNHHCAQSCIDQLSTPKKDYFQDGFYAETLEKEVKCPEIEINRLVEIKDVTEQIQKETQKLEGKEFNDKLKAISSKLEKECSQGQDSLRCDIVTLYEGGKYNLYKYQRYQDVRLVFSPEFAIAFFGGDPDNFMFPRFDLDMSFLRVYENNKPLSVKDYFKWSTGGAKDGELTFVTGHPGHTSRMLAVTQLEYMRDIQLPKNLIFYSELRGLLTQYQNLGAEQKRNSNSKLFGIENSLKATKGKFDALTDKNIFAQKVEAEQKLIAKLKSNPKLKAKYGMAWSQMAEAYTELKKIRLELLNFESNSFGTSLFGIAKNLVRSSKELKKPNELRLREYNDSALPQMKQKLFSKAPIYKDFEIVLFEFYLTKMREELGPDHQAIKLLFGNKSPKTLAKEIIEKTKIDNVEIRQKLFDGGEQAIKESTDPMIEFAKNIEVYARPLRAKYEDEIDTKIKKNSERIAKANFEVYGDKNYPDATFTLRISYGQVKGYDQLSGHVKPFTTFEGAFDRHTGEAPFKLPESWMNAKTKLNLKTNFNFCSTNDIIGGNSGSPVINKNSEIVGLIFDGNIQSLGGDFGYDASVNRAVAVNSEAILEALDKVYAAKRIKSEIEASRK